MTHVDAGRHPAPRRNRRAPGADGTPDLAGTVTRTALAGIPSYLTGSRYAQVGHGAIGAAGGLGVVWLLTAAALFVAPLGVVALVLGERARRRRVPGAAGAVVAAAFASAAGWALPLLLFPGL